LELDRSKIELEASNQQLRELDRLKNDFLANVSHELRTPLTLLLAPIESMRLQQDLAPAQRELITTMHQQSLRLLKLINDLLDIAKLESGKLQLRCERVNLGDFVNGVIESISVIARQRNLTVTAHVSDGVATVETDRDKLEKICLNLLFNALKFTPEYGRVHLGVRRSEDKPCVHDQGHRDWYSIRSIALHLRAFLAERFVDQAEASGDGDWIGSGERTD